MTQLQRVVLVVGVILIALSAAFPPWVYTFTRPGMAVSSRPAGYASILTPPELSSSSITRGVRVDVTRLVVQIGGIVVVFGGLFIAASKRLKDPVE